MLLPIKPYLQSPLPQIKDAKTELPAPAKRTAKRPNILQLSGQRGQLPGAHCGVTEGDIDVAPSLHSYLPPKNNNGSTCRSPLAVDTCRYTNASLKTDRHISQFSYNFPRHWRYREPVCTVGEGRSQHKFIRSVEILCANILTMCKTERLD